MTFKPRPYDPDRVVNQTPAQEAATKRNFRIFQLRGLHAQMYLLTGPRRAMAQELVDLELVAMGADKMEAAGLKAREKRLRKRAKQRALEIDDDDIPF